LTDVTPRQENTFFTDARTPIDQLQPYRDRARMDHHYLSMLAALSNNDKHRIIQAAFRGIDEIPDGSLGRQDVGGVLERSVWRGPLEVGTCVLDCTLAITGPNPQVLAIPLEFRQTLLGSAGSVLPILEVPDG
jgi:hypothetical protein